MSRTIFTRRFLTLVLAISVLLSTLAPVIALAESSGIGGKPANPDSSNPLEATPHSRRTAWLSPRRRRRSAREQYGNRLPRA